MGRGGGAISEPVVLTGRDGELELLERAWERTSAGQQQVVLVTGEPGIGKTRLALEFARRIAVRATVLVGRCDCEALVAYAPWIAILQWMIRTTAAETLRRRLAGIDGSTELVQIVPEIAARIHVGQPPVPVTPDGRRYRMFEAASETCSTASQGGPILLVIEDLQWADRGIPAVPAARAPLHPQRRHLHSVTHRNDVPNGRRVRDLVESLRREHAPTRLLCIASRTTTSAAWSRSVDGP